MLPPLISPEECQQLSDDEPYDLRQGVLHEGMQDDDDTDTDEEPEDPVAPLSSGLSPGLLPPLLSHARAPTPAKRARVVVLSAAAVLPKM